MTQVCHSALDTTGFCGFTAAGKVSLTVRYFRHLQFLLAETTTYVGDPERSKRSDDSDITRTGPG